MICVFSLGCKVNSYESDVLKNEFSSRGYKVTDKLEFADIYIINTCAVTNEAERKSRQAVARVLKINPNAKIFIMGCASQKNYSQFERYPNVRYITGNREKSSLASVILEKTYEKSRIDNFEMPTDYLFHNHAKQSQIRAFVKIQDGCNNFCSYCIIPYLRGRSRSRKIEDIIDEVQSLEKQNIKEIVLTGIDMSSFQIDGKNALGDLIERLTFFTGRIRLGSLEVGVVTPEFVAKLKKCQNLCPHFHLSLQSGSDVVLKSMNRKYSIKEYEYAVNLLRNNFDNPAITTDLIVGFPTETQQEFDNTCKAISKIGFAQMHIFPYSKREGTVACKLYESIDGFVVKQRLQIVDKLAKHSCQKYLKQFYNKNLRVLFEEKIGDFYYGYSDNYIKICTKIPQAIGNLSDICLDLKEYFVAK